MKKATLLLKACNLGVMFIIMGLTTLTSCSSNSNESNIETIEEELISHNNRHSYLIDTLAVSNWNVIRKTQDSVIDIFNTTGNIFSFKKDSIVADSILHIYAGWSDGRYSLTLIKATNDTQENNTCMLTTYPVSTIQHKLPEIEILHKNNPDAIKRNEASNRIKNWSTASIRNEWINQRINISTTGVFQIFRVNTVDFEYGIKHDCYFALRQDSLSYVADLIIVNRKNNKIGPITNGSVEDLTQPIPPLGGHNLKNYGLWQRINNQ
ncbi:MAG: hypothetical protein ACI93P_001790 [bacterium]|jgi:hypothetical protein